MKGTKNNVRQTLLLGTTCCVSTKRADVGLQQIMRSVKMQICTLFLHIVMQ